MSIQTRLALSISALIACTLLGAFAILGAAELSHSRRAQEARLRLALEKTVKVSEEAVLNHNDVLLLNYLRSLSDLPGFAYGAFADSKGRVVAHTDVSRLGTPSGPESSDPALEELVSPVSAAGRGVGSVRLAFRREALDAAVRAVLLDSMRRSWPVVLLALLAGVAGAAALARYFNQPIAELTAGARLIGEGRLETRLPEDRKDELGRLAAEFNGMAVKLKELEQLKESFLHSVSHEMRTPLTAIQAYASALNQDGHAPQPELLARGLKIIHSETERLNGFINDILDLAKLQARMLELKREPIDLGELAREVCELFGPKAKELKIALAAEADGRVPVDGDREAVRRAIVNLVSNALKFTPDGGKISVRAEDRGTAARIVVQDSGIGIPKDRLGKLFSRFNQVHGDRAGVRKASGTGLGLALVKEIVEAHGGVVGVESDEGQGASFRFDLPRNKS